MSDFIDILTHGRRLKAAVKELSIAELESVQTKLAKVIDDRREEEAELRKLEAEKQEKFNNSEKLWKMLALALMIWLMARYQALKSNVNARPNRLNMLLAMLTASVLPGPVRDACQTRLKMPYKKAIAWINT